MNIGKGIHVYGTLEQRRETLTHPMNELIAKIEKAFADVEYPGDNDLTDSTYGEEPAALVIEFRGKTDWRRLDAAFLRQAPDGWVVDAHRVDGASTRWTRCIAACIARWIDRMK